MMSFSMGSMFPKAKETNKSSIAAINSNTIPLKQPIRINLMTHFDKETNKHAVVYPADAKIRTQTSDIAILLTSTVYINTGLHHVYQRSPEERLSTYVKSITQWLQDTDFKIIVVENSGYTYPEFANLWPDRFEVISYVESELPEAAYLKKEREKGANELFAIQYAYKQSQLLQDSPFIIKVTARYFIPALQPYLSQIAVKKYAALSQENGDRCEMVGARKDHFAKIFDKRNVNRLGKKENHVEYVYRDRMQSLPKNQVLRCREFAIEPTERGGVNQVFTTI